MSSELKKKTSESYFNDEEDENLNPDIDSDEEEDVDDIEDDDDELEKKDEDEYDVDEDQEDEDEKDEDDDELDEEKDRDRDRDREKEKDKKTTKNSKYSDSIINIPQELPLNIGNIHIDDDDSDEDSDGEDYLKKFDKDTQSNYIMNFHPENKLHNYDEILTMSRVFRNQDGSLDDFHKTVPFLTKFEKTRILGQRAKQINAGAQPFINVPEGIIDGYLVAKMELEQKKIPFIIKRPLPNGGSEYWKLSDLEDIIF